MTAVITSKLPIFKGRVWKFGSNLDVDRDILSVHLDTAEMRERVMAYVNPEFPKKVQKGDIIVAGRNFGCGHGHDQAPYAIMQCGVAVLIAESFGRQFFRNSIALGLPLLTCPTISEKVEDGDELEVDVETATIRNLRTNEEINAKPNQEILLQILRAGGQLPVLKAKLGL